MPFKNPLTKILYTKEQRGKRKYIYGKPATYKIYKKKDLSCLLK